MVDAINPATADYIQRQEHYNRLQSEKRYADRLEDNRQIEQIRRLQEDGKGQNVDIMA
jgi:hypothetical protein